jgi:hypothetical protein
MSRTLTHNAERVETSLTHDIELVETWGLTRRDAVRLVARVVLLQAEEGARYSSSYLRDLHGLMVATA